MPKSWFTLFAVLGLSGPAVAAEPLGDWLVADKVAAVRVSPCGDALCGNLAWTKGPPGTDKNNPDPTKRSRSVIGMPILLDMKQAAANRWEGEIYNAEDGRTYSGRMVLSEENVLRIEGCVLGFLCGGQNWARAKCEEAPAPATAGRSPSAPKRAAPTPPTAAQATVQQPLPALASCREVVPER